MKIRRFFAADMRQAIRIVRDEQGPDAVILSSRRVEGGIEIVSAIDYDQELVSEMAGEAELEDRSGASGAPFGSVHGHGHGEPDSDRTGRGRRFDSDRWGQTQWDQTESNSFGSDRPGRDAPRFEAQGPMDSGPMDSGRVDPARTPGMPGGADAVLEPLLPKAPGARAPRSQGTAPDGPGGSAGAGSSAANTPAPDATRFDATRAEAGQRPSSATRPGPTAAASRQRQIVWSQDPALAAMQQEIGALRMMLHDQLASLAWNDLRQREPEKAQLIHRLEHLGLDGDLARTIAAGVRHGDSPEYSWREALAGLALRIPAAPESRLDGDGVVALVGPSGVGKTTTVAKLAALHVQRHGRQSLALVTTDAYRIGAYRQLQTYGQILGVSVHLAKTGRELGDILSGLGEKQRVFVDTAGMSQRDLHLMEDMAGLTAIPRLRTLLVVAANTQQAVLEETFRAFGHLPLHGAVLTKVDEAASLGPAFSALCRGELPLMYVSEGQRVPEDLQVARVQRLISHAITLVGETQVVETQGFEDPGVEGPGSAAQDGDDAGLDSRGLHPRAAGDTARTLRDPAEAIALTLPVQRHRSPYASIQ